MLFNEKNDQHCHFNKTIKLRIYLKGYFAEFIKESLVDGTLRGDILKRAVFTTVKRICANKQQLKKFTNNKVLRTKLKKDYETLYVVMKKTMKRS